MYQRGIDNLHSSAPERRPIAWVTWFLVGSTLATFLAQLAAFQLYGSDVLGDALAFSPQSVAEHRYWTALTYAWAHAVDVPSHRWLFWLHISFNLLSLAWFGPAVEELLGRWQFLALYLGGAVVAAFTWLYLSPLSEADQGIIGASGAVYAVIAALGMLAPRDWELVIYPFALPLGRRIRLVVFLICATEVLPLVFNWMPEIAHWAHIGGAAFGFLYVWIYHLVSPPRHLSD
jgi:membrane associated rhomboid family serine protease